MAEQYQVLHIEKRTQISSHLGRHVDRSETVETESIVEVTDDGETILEPSVMTMEFFPDNADPNRGYLNRELIPRPKKVLASGKERYMTIDEAVRYRIHSAGIGRIRETKNVALEIIFSGSPDTMRSMSELTLMQWAKDTVQWAKDTFGDENVISAALHRDESTPHIHMYVAPIVSGPSRSTLRKRESRKQKALESGEEYTEYKTRIRNRLCADDLLGSDNIYRYHDSYSQITKKYGLSRGVKAEKGSKVRHKRSIDYKRELIRDLELRNRELTEQVEELKQRKELLVKRNEELQKISQSRFDYMSGVFTRSSFMGMEDMAEELLKSIVKHYLKDELMSYAEKEKGGYAIALAKGNQTYCLTITADGKVWKSDGCPLVRKNDGKQVVMHDFINFFKVVPNREFYRKLLDSTLDKIIAMRPSGSSAQKPVSPEGTPIHRGGGALKKGDKDRTPIYLGHGGGINTPTSDEARTDDSEEDENTDERKSKPIRRGMHM